MDMDGSKIGEVRLSEVTEFPNHYIDSLGNLYKGEKRVNTSVSSQGCKAYSRKVDGKMKTVLIHRLVAKYFLEPHPKWNCIRFKDGNKLNCSVDNLEWYPVDRAKRRSVDTIKRELEMKFPRLDFSLLTTYKNNKTKFKVICPIHGPFDTSYNGITSTEYGCKACAQEVITSKNTYTQQEFLALCEGKFGDKFDYSKVVYQGAHDVVTVKCNACLREYGLKAYRLLQSIGCKYCSASSKQVELFNYLSRYDPDIQFDHRPSWLRFNKDDRVPKELDIFLPRYNLAIEYNGTYYHRDSALGSEFHLKKYNICKDNGITLIHIFDTEDFDEWLTNLSLFLENRDKYQVDFTNELRVNPRGHTYHGRSKIN